MKTIEKIISLCEETLPNYNNQIINKNEFIKEIKSGNYPLAIKDGLLNKLSTMDNAYFFKNEGAILLAQIEKNEALINHIERKKGEYKGAGGSLMKFVLSKLKGKQVRLTAQGGNPKLINFYKYFGFKETGEPCSFGVRMIKNN